MADNGIDLSRVTNLSSVQLGPFTPVGPFRHRRNTTCKHGVMTGPDIDGELCVDCATTEVGE